MVENLSDTESKILAVLQQGFPKSPTPYGDIAGQAGIETVQLLAVLEDWKQKGLLRRIGAIVNHFKVGLGAGAMVVWQVEPQHVQQVGEILAHFKEVSHCYERSIDRNWPYNLYTMVHAAGPADIDDIVKSMSRACGVEKYRVLVTERELKKTPPTYIKQRSEKNVKKQE
jgi:DNA-binding Lrp family transcriptional regulator